MKELFVFKNIRLPRFKSLQPKILFEIENVILFKYNLNITDATFF